MPYERFPNLGAVNIDHDFKFPANHVLSYLGIEPTQTWGATTQAMDVKYGTYMKTQNNDIYITTPLSP